MCWEILLFSCETLIGTSLNRQLFWNLGFQNCRQTAIWCHMRDYFLKTAESPQRPKNPRYEVPKLVKEPLWADTWSKYTQGLKQENSKQLHKREENMWRFEHALPELCLHGSGDGVIEDLFQTIRGTCRASYSILLLARATGGDRSN